MKTIGELLPRCPGKACHLPLDRVYESKSKHPELWGATLMACVQTQTRILFEMWAEEYPQDRTTWLAWRSLVDLGEFPRLMDINGEGGKIARLMFRSAIAGITTNGRTDKQVGWSAEKKAPL